jgi:tripartite-type tricarboxylate transporter receptor subunit TctC
MAWRQPAVRLAFGAVMALVSVSPVMAQGAADFFHGKTISLVMGTGPGGSYDLYSRAIAEFLGRHVPGNPTVIIEHMPGAGGVVAANNVYALLPQDGTQILLTHVLPMIEKLTPSQGVRFQSAKFNWLGAYGSIAQVFAFWHNAGVQTVEDLKTKPVVVGTFNKTHLTYQWAMLVKNTLGAQYKVITGYPSGNELDLAMERGEIGGWVAAWENLAVSKPDWLKDGSVVIPIQLNPDRLSALPRVPTLLELAPLESKDVVEFVSSGQPLSRGIAVGPKVPPDRVAALRTAFDDLMADQDFLAEAKKRNLDIQPRNAAQASALVDKIISAGPDLVARVKKMTGQDE